MVITLCNIYLIYTLIIPILPRRHGTWKMMNDNEEESTTEKITLEDVTEFGKKVGISSYSCTRNEFVKALLVFINKIYLNEVVADRMNLECLKILIGEPKEMLTLVEGIYDAWKITDKKNDELLKDARQHNREMDEVKSRARKNISDNLRMTKNDRVLGAMMVSILDSEIDRGYMNLFRGAQHHLHGNTYIDD
tara:strand:+ start:54 stop:632 length:579 start_codon:yes stop_codon:yes gene_type:complete